MKRKLLSLLIFLLLGVSGYAQINYAAANATNIAGTYTDLGTSGTVITTTDFDDANSAPVNIGFTFNFNGSAFTQFILNTNGFIKLGNVAPSAANLYYADLQDNSTGGVFGSTDPLNTNILAPFHMDLNGGTAPEYRVATTGTAGSRVTTIQFENLKEWSTAGQYNNISFQIKLYEGTNVIDFVYGPFTPSANASNFELTEVGLKGTGAGVIAVTKASTSAWSGATFLNTNYTGNTHNHRNTVLPDAGRTYRFTPNAGTDAAVNAIYTVSELAIPYATPHTISANVSNTGGTTLSNLVVTLNITGANTYTTTATIASLAVGASTNVQFTFNPANTGTNTVTVSVPTDGNTTNNSKTASQVVTNNSISYAFGTTPDGGAGFTTTPGLSLAARFALGSTPVNLTEVRTFFNTAGEQFEINIYDATGTGGTPGTLLFTAPVQTAVLGENTTAINPALPLPGAFFIAVKQVNTVNFGIGYQIENPLRAGSFFSGDGTTWNDLSPGVTFRPMIKAIIAPPTSVNDVAVNAVYTYGELAIPFAAPHQVKAVVTNNGTTTKASLAVTLNVTGAVTHSNTQTVTNLAPGASATVTFTAYTPSSTGTATVTVSVPADGDNSNNSVAVTQTITNSSTSFAYGTTADDGVGFTSGTGYVSAKFNTSVNANLNEVRVTFYAGGEPFRVHVHADNAGLPGTILYSSAILTSILGENSIPVSPAVALPAGAYHISVEQTGMNNFSLGTQFEVPTRAATFYYGDATTWTDLATVLDLRLMIETVLSQSVDAQFTASTTTPCTGQTVTFTNTTTGAATTYSWNFGAGATPATATGPGPHNVTYSTSGMKTVALTASNATATDTETKTNFINVSTTPAQPAAITGSTAVCANSSQTYSVAAVTGATSYTWTLPSGWAGASTTNSITATAGTAGGTISVTASNSCGTSTARTATITVSTVPSTPGTITGSATVCQTSSQTYSVAPVAGATSYTWTMPSGWTGSSTTASITATAGSSGNITVTANNSCGSSAAQTFSVTATPVPAQPAAISGGATLCANAMETYTINPVSGASSYTWTLPSGWSGTSTTTSIAATAGTTGGTISVTANNSCGSGTPQTLAVTVNSTPVQPAAITGSTSVCQGATQVYSVPTVAGVTYTWTLPGGWSGASTSNTISATAGASGGTISVTATNNCGTSTAQTAAVTVNTVPSMPGGITGATEACPASSQTYSVSPVAGAVSYIWTLPSGWSGSSTTNSITATAGSTGTISVAAVNSCGNSPAQTASVTVTPVPSQPAAISGSLAACANATEIYSVSPVTGATSYTWTLPSGWVGTSTTNSISATVGTAGGTISVTASNVCGTSSTQTALVSVTTVPAQPGAITGADAICEGSVNTYSIAPVSGATGYTWTLPPGWVGTSSTTSISATSNNISGPVSVTADNACGSGTPQTLNVSVSTAAIASVTIDANATTICAGDPVTFTATPANGGTAPSYQWMIDGAPVGTNSNTFTTTSLANGDVVTVSMTSNAGCVSGSPATSNAITITISTTVTPTIAIAADVNPACSGSPVTFTAEVTGAGTTPAYQWKVNGSNVGTNSPTFVSSSLVNGDVVTAELTSSSSCSPGAVVTSNAVTMTVVGSIAASVNITPSANPACAGAPVTFTANPGNGGSTPAYQWKVNGANVGANSDTYTSTTLASSDVVTVVMTSSLGCATNSPATSNAVTMDITPNVPASVSIAADQDPACAGAPVTFTATATNGGNAPMYQWKLNNVTVGTNSATYINSTLSTGDVVFAIMTSSETCVTGSPAASNALTISIGQAPAQPASITGSANVCENDASSYSIVAVAGATSYTWTLPSGWSGTSTTNSISTTAGTTGGTISVVANNACGSSTAQTFTVGVTNLPAQPAAIIGSATICEGSVNTYSIAPVTGATAYSWTLPTGWSGTSNTTSITATSSSTGGTINVTAINGCGTGTAQTLAVSTDPVVAVSVTIDADNNPVCAGEAITFTATPVNGGFAASYQWKVNSANAGTNSSTFSSSTLANGDAVTVVMTSSEICVSNSPATSNAVTASINPLPVKPVITQNLNTLATTSTAASYQWFFNGTAITGANTQIYNALASGFYSLTITDANGCQNTSDMFNFTYDGIEEQAAGITARIYPNPATQSFTIEASGLEGKSIITLHNVLGEIMVGEEVSTGPSVTLDINIQSIPSGVYFVTIENEGKRIIRRVIKN